MQYDEVNLYLMSMSFFFTMILYVLYNILALNHFLNLLCSFYSCEELGQFLIKALIKCIRFVLVKQAFVFVFLILI